MIIYSIVALLLGLVLGQRFKVLILLPAASFVLLGAIAITMAHAGSLLDFVVLSALALTTLEVGYLVGSGLRVVLAAARISRRRAPVLDTPQVGRAVL
jgi:hypothetical protein